MTPQGDTAAQKQTSVRAIKDQALADLYREKPEAKDVVEKAAGYAVFSNINIKILAFGSGNGYGIAVDNETGQETFMRMAEVGVGLGVGAKNIRTIFAFEERSRFREFVEQGWTFGAEASAAAKHGEEGDAAASEASLEEGIEVFQLTESGLMASAMVSGTKYWTDEDLQ